MSDKEKQKELELELSKVVAEKLAPIIEGVNKVCKGIECLPEIVDKLGKFAEKESIKVEDLTKDIAKLLDEKGILSKADVAKFLEEKAPKPKVDAHDVIKDYKALSFLNFCPECGDKIREVPEKYVACSDCGVPIAHDVKTAKEIKACWNCGGTKAKEVLRKLKV